jgi:hypothetical protein
MKEDISTSRDQHLQALRPDLGIDTTQSSATETFQHETLRPLLKFQHSILVRQFDAFLAEHKQQLTPQPAERRSAYIAHALKTHKRLRATLFGLVSGLMTDTEYDFYLSNRSEVNKRLTQMLIQRLESHWNPA